MDNKHIFSINLKRLMERKGVTRKDVADALGVSYFTVTDWVNGKKYPRMDKVELLANFFGVLKSDLIEEESGTDDTPPLTDLTDGELYLLELFRRVPEDKQKMLIQMIRIAAETQ